MFLCLMFFFFFKQKTAYEMRISDWSSDVCSSDLTSPSSADTKPAGPNRLAWRSRRRVISGVSSAKPKWVQTKSKASWPTGWMWRVDSEFTCCWITTLGNSVINTAVGPFHQGSGTMSRNRSSLSCICSLKLDTPCVTEPFRSEEHTSELQSLMRISYAVFCLKKKTYNKTHPLTTYT